VLWLMTSRTGIARNYHAGLCLAAALHWLTTGVRNTP